MIRIKARHTALAVVVVAALATVTACSSTPADTSSKSKAVDYGLTQPGTISAAVTAGGAPFASIDASGKPIGWFVDLNDRIAKDLNLKTSYKATDLNGGLGGLTSGSYDLMAVGLVETPERAQQVGFTKPIFWGQNAVLVRSDSTVTQLSDLKGLRVGAGTGSQQLDFANASLKSSKIVTEASSALGVSQLLNGNLDVFMIGASHVGGLEKENPGKLKLAFAVDQSQPGGMAINKKLTKFRATYNKEIGKLINNGTFIKLYYKWFDTKTVPYPTSMYKYWPVLKGQVAAMNAKQ